MEKNLTLEQLNKCSKEELILTILSMQSQLDKLNENMEALIEQIRIANQHQFGRQTEKMDGQLSFFIECEALYDESIAEPEAADVVASVRKRKQPGKREADLKDFPEEPHDHDISADQLDEVYGEGNWREFPTEEYKRLRYEPASWTVEKHMVHVYVGTGGEHQDEFIRGDRPNDVLRNSILTPSLGAAIINAKYVNSIPLARIEAEFQRNGVNLSRQTMSNWVIRCSELYFHPMYEYLHKKLLAFPVTQADETPVDVIHDGRPAGSKSFMWVHRTGEFYTDGPIVLYEYQKGRGSEHPKEFYKDYKGILVTDGLSQYHKLSRELEGVTNANCWAHARRDFADAVKAIGKGNEDAVKHSIAYQALARISTIYKLEGTLMDIPVR